MYINKQSNIQKKDLVSTKTASGNPVVITDCAGGKARSLKTTIEAIQDLHGYDHPWAGGAGKNLFNPTALTTTQDGVTFTNNGDGTYTLNGTATADSDFSIESFSVPIPNVQYKMVGCPTGSSLNAFLQIRGTSWYDDGNGSIATTGDTNVHPVQIRVKNGATFNNVVFKPMFSLDTTITYDDFEPYANICPISGRTAAVITRSDGDEISEDFTIQLGQTVYGADINWDTGVATVTWVSLVPTEVESVLYESGLGLYYWIVVSTISSINGANVISDSFKSEHVAAAGNCYISSQGRQILVIPVDQTLNTKALASAWVAANTPQFVYKLATPTTIQLTPTQLQMLKGYNRVTIDNGSIELEYVPDNLAGDIISLVEEELEEININIGLGETVSADMANCLPPRFKDISNDYYNGNLKAEIAAGNFRNVRPGDYIIGSSTGSKYVVGACDYWYNKGDTACTTHHLRLMLVEVKNITQLWAGLPYDGGTGHWAGLNRCPWNAAVDVDPTSVSAVGSNSTNISRTITISGTGTASPTTASASGYAGSFIRDRLIARLLPDCFVADFGSANVLLCRNLNGNAVTTDKPSAAMSNWNGMTSGWAWMDSQIELPSEVELYGTMVFSSSAMDVGCQDQQLALFRNVSIEQVVGRTDVWTKAVASSTDVCYRHNHGNAYANYASRALCALPLANVK